MKIKFKSKNRGNNSQGTGVCEECRVCIVPVKIVQLLHQKSDFAVINLLQLVYKLMGFHIRAIPFTNPTCLLQDNNNTPPTWDTDKASPSIAKISVGVAVTTTSTSTSSPGEAKGCDDDDDDRAHVVSFPLLPGLYSGKFQNYTIVL